MSGSAPFFSQHTGRVVTLNPQTSRDFDAARDRPMRLRQPLRGVNDAEPKTLNLALDTATTDYEVLFRGNCLRFGNSSDVNATIQVKFNSRSGDAITLHPGDAWLRKSFEKIYITWAAQALVTAEINLMLDDPSGGDLGIL